MSDRTRHRRLGRAAVAATLLAATLTAMAACAPPPPVPTNVKLTVDVAKDANTTEAGQGAPTIVRVYQLTSTAAFEKAEFFRLYNGDTALLGPDMVKRDEYLLAPGTKKEDMLSGLPDRVTALGFVAAYREFNTLPWRATVPVPPHATTPVVVTVAKAGLSVK